MSSITTRRLLLGLLAGIMLVPCFNHADAQYYGRRQYYGRWNYRPQYSYHYRYYYYQPYAGASSYQYHYAIHYPTPARRRYVYYYNPHQRVYWGRLDLQGKEGAQYSILKNEDRKASLDDIPESAFPAPAKMPPIPESEDGVPMEPFKDLPGEDLPGGPAPAPSE